MHVHVDRLTETKRVTQYVHVERKKERGISSKTKYVRIENLESEKYLEFPPGLQALCEHSGEAVRLVPRPLLWSTHPWCANLPFLLPLGPRGGAKLQRASVDVEASELGA